LLDEEGDQLSASWFHDKEGDRSCLCRTPLGAATCLLL